MKNYSSNRAQKGKLAFRTPSMFIAKKTLGPKPRFLFKPISRQHFKEKPRRKS